MVHAHRWVEEQKRGAFGQFDGVAFARLSVPESDIAEYGRYLDRLDKVLGSIEQYIHHAYAGMNKGDVVRRLYHMMASTKYQLGELNKPNPRSILELHTIRGMFQEADNMDKGLRTVLGIGTPKSPKGKATTKPKPPPRRKVSAKVNNVETPTTTSIVTSTPASSTPIDTKGGAKRVRDDDVAPGVLTALSPRRVKSDWEGPPNEEPRKRDDQALAFVESVTKFIDENPESAEAASDALDEILRTSSDSTVVPPFGFNDLQSISPPPHPFGNDVFGEFIDMAAFYETPTPDLVAGSSTNPSPESTSDQPPSHGPRRFSPCFPREGKGLVWPSTTSERL
ncbi:hypothetical protein BGW80DRAFT_1445679 [Lactifluus volemus]|nr:hypothetical protein BGW80DRAFT_1445679 [Lactifluus volemus]